MKTLPSRALSRLVLFGVLLALFLWTGSLLPVRAQEATPTQEGTLTPSSAPAITSPQAGQTLLGVVTITGTTALDGFLTGELSFAYADNPTGSWFALASGLPALTDGALAAWDTTAITDGFYTLRLRVYRSDGTSVDFLVENLWVRNYTPDTPTPTLTPTATIVVVTEIIPTETPTPTVTPSPFPTPTQLPTNPATLPVEDVYTGLSYGALGILGAFLLAGVYLLIRRKW